MFQQNSLFELPEKEVILERDGKTTYYSRFLENPDAAFQTLQENLAWQEDEIAMYGKVHKVPRLQAWYGEKNYAYSGLQLKVHPWNEELLSIKKAVEQKLGLHFNSVLANLYRDGNDHVSWHADDEVELGKNPIIASLSLGETRRFSLKHKNDKGQELIIRDLEDNSLLLMEGELQHHWVHRLHKTSREIGPRINLTFRTIVQ